MLRCVLIPCVVSLVLSGVGVALPAVTVQDVTPLGIYSIGFTNTTSGTVGAGVNDLGQVVGYGFWSWLPDKPWTMHGWRYDTNGPLTDIGNMAITPGQNLVCQDNGINATGATAGFAATDTWTHAFVYSGGTMTDLGSLTGADGYSKAYAINDAGQVTGASTYSPGGDSNHTHAIVTSGGTMYDIGGLAGSTISQGMDINAGGSVAGYSWFSTAGFNQAWVWAPTVANGSTGTFQNLGTLGGTFAVALSINDAAQAVGRSWDGNSVMHAFLWTSGTGMTDLGFLPGGTASEANDINNRGMVVGESTVDGVTKAMIWTSTGGMQDLYSLLPADSGWTSLTWARSISDNGYITGSGIYNGVVQAYRLRLALPGDANLDSKVDVNDLTKVLTNYSQSTGANGWGLGDFNGDNKVDVNDLTVVLTNYNQSFGSSSAGSVLVAVPEPSSLALIALGALGLLALAWRRAA
jgi:probable HAF family extracellular repeat protein